QLRLLHGGECELEKERRRLLSIREEVERQQRRALHSVGRRGCHTLAHQGPDDEVGTALSCRGDLVGNGLVTARVVDAHDGTLLHRCLVISRQESITHTGRERAYGTCDGQQQGDVRLRCERLRLLAEELAAHHLN